MTQYNSFGVAVDIAVWSEERRVHRSVRTKILGSNVGDPSYGFQVLTSFVGIDAEDAMPPMVFESLVFKTYPLVDNVSAVEIDERRYATLIDSLIGHRRLVSDYASQFIDPIVRDY